MKTNLLSGQSMTKKVVLVYLLFLMNAMSFAQLNKVYASSQTNRAYGICVACFVQNPENAVGSNENDYSTLLVPLGLLGRTEQTLIFPTSNILADTNKLVIGVGTDQSILTAQLIGGISVETFLGDVSNNDYMNIFDDVLKLGGADASRGALELTMNKPFDRVKISLNSGLLNLNGGFRIYYSYQYKDPYISLMANSKDGQITLDGKIAFEGSEVTLVNSSGKEVYRSKLQSKTFESRQPEGFYILTLKTKDGKLYSRKIMIK
ncbi:T9SS type A sorting domain-containing protein [Chryseobacterium antibioticum]|uniref:T9SS type A sorting domain-containing protein n=1 Tax=Chryseobacterium pyrolae TaxID=2987481 RepID=A0ABT2IMC1_9FLAO|nr:T9SS type A sorting domain-containing protein [Chryseobacterium pyrolae]MCT2409813.1 T9SS type A sorting domain-containing protein [Chryseobacterium pyrolae]